MTSVQSNAIEIQPHRIAGLLARLALAVGVVCAAAALLAGPLYRMHLVSLGAGLQTMRWAATAAVGGAGVALVAAVWSGTRGDRRSLAIAASGLVINLLVAAPPIYLYRDAQRLPHIHDVSTDTDHPPVFVAVLPLRQNARNSTDYLPETAVQQKKGYPDIAPLMLDMAPDQAFARAERTARAMGWDIVAVAPQDMRIEATDTTLLFGFKDDIVIRVSALAQKSVVDMRSESRVGGSDFGVNAKRIRAFMQKLAAS